MRVSTRSGAASRTTPHVERSAHSPRSPRPEPGAAPNPAGIKIESPGGLGLPPREETVWILDAAFEGEPQLAELESRAGAVEIDAVARGRDELYVDP